MIIRWGFGFRRRVGNDGILLFVLLRSGLLGFCLFSGKSGFFRFALLFGKTFLLGTFFGFKTLGF